MKRLRIAHLSDMHLSQFGERVTPRALLGGKLPRAGLITRVEWEDFEEQRDLAEEHPEVAERLNALAGDYLRSPPPPWGEAPTVEIDEMQLHQLRALGYGVR